MQNFSLLAQLISYEEKKMVWIQPLRLYLQHFIIFVSYKLAQ